MFFPPGFDKVIATEAASLVLQAYAQYSAFKVSQAWALQGNYQNLGMLEARPDDLSLKGEPFGFVALNIATGNVFVTFRGTESIFDWMADLSIAQVPHAWGKVAKGFEFVYQQCSGSVITAVARAPGATVFVTGHSLGAALAVLASADLANAAGITPQLYSFANPRTGDPDFAAKFNQNVPVHWRIANTEDIVTTVWLATGRIDAAGSTEHSAVGIVLERISGLEFQHVGDAVPFTVQRGSIVQNHDMAMYRDTISAA